MILQSSRDPAAVPFLIESLEHDDPVVRMAAIHALEQQTGQTLGYDYAAPQWERQERVEAWAAWYKQRPETRSGAEAQIPPPSRPIEGGVR